MCDDFTAADDAARAARGLDRRAFTALGASAALVGCTGGAGRAGAGDAGPLRERMVSITTPDGVCDAFFVHPAEGRHPGVVTWPDIAGLRDAFKIMARSLAAQGYAVLVVNPYYRSSPAPVLRSFSEWRTEEGQARIAPMREALDPAAVMRDAAAYVAFLDGRAEVDTARGIGTNGYCMGGPFTVRSARVAAERVRAAASFHGAGLVTEEGDSPHRVLGETKASYLFAIARNDDARQPGQKSALTEAAAKAGRPAEVEVYAADHGWCVPDSPAWDPDEADRAWQRMLALFQTL